MIYDDQPQMVQQAMGPIADKVAGQRARDPAVLPIPEVAKLCVKGVFAAIDREALIEKAAEGIPSNDPGGFVAPATKLRFAERVLVAAGIIPGRELGVTHHSGRNPRGDGR